MTRADQMSAKGMMARSLPPLALLLCLTASALAAPRPLRVVIDPGHGGKDEGAKYGRVHEKHVTLALAKQVAERLRARGISVYLTRSGDEEVSLASRTSLANRLKADVFLSIHMNSSHAAGGEGIETYILNTATDATSKRLAHFENVGLSVQSGAAGADGDQTDVALILQDLRLDANLSESKRLACSIQSQLVNAAGAAGQTRTLAGVSGTSRGRNRGVKQALFYVLLGANMPSVLVEAGFLNSARDRARVLTTAGQAQVASAISRAVEQFDRTKGTELAQVALSRCQVH